MTTSWIPLYRRAQFGLGSVAFWIVVVWLVAVTIQLEPGWVPTWPRTVLTMGAALGVIAAVFELSLLPRYARRATSRRVFLTRTAFYTLAPAAVIALTGRIVGASDLWGEDTLRALWLVVVASTWGNYTRQVRLMLGPGTQRALLFGHYARPVHEERVFLFVDLTDSTPIAERLGPAAFNDFKNDFFYDVTEPVLATRGQIYQYVGDEVVVTWPVGRGKPAGSALRAYALLEERVAANRDRYEKRYGVAPTFKAGIHAGPVVTAEVGDIKKDIVHSGDTVNTASRIIGECRPLGARLLMSEAAARLLEIPEGLVATPLGEVRLRGKEEAVALLRVDRSPVETPLR